VGLSPADLEDTNTASELDHIIEWQTESNTSITASAEHLFEIVFIDEATPEYQRLIQDIVANQSEDRVFEIITIQSDENGLELISDTLADRTNIDAVHLISHGADGNVNLGNTGLNHTTFTTQESMIKQWREAFSSTGDLLIYGCNFAASETGASLGVKIAALLDVNVASSDDATGGLQGYSDWVLESVVGAVDTTVPFSDEIQNSYNRSLANTITITIEDDTVDAPSTATFDDLIASPGADGGISLREAVMAANLQTGPDTINLPAGTYNLTISGINDNDGSTGDLDIT